MPLNKSVAENPHLQKPDKSYIRKKVTGSSEDFFAPASLRAEKKQMKQFTKVDPSITFDHMHPDEKSDAAENKSGSQLIMFALEITTVIALLAFMMLMLK